MPRKIPWSLIFTLALAGVLLFLAFRGVDWDEMLDTLRSGDLALLTASTLVIVVSITLRGWRWHVLVTGEKPVPIMIVMWGTFIGYMGNALLPARAGELIRTWLVGVKGQVTKSYVFATVISERVLDAAFLVALAIITIPLTLDTIPDWLYPALQVMGFLAVVGTLGLLVAYQLRGIITAVINRLPLPAALQERILQLATRFLDGTRPLQDWRRSGQFVILTLVIWLADMIAMLMTAAAFSQAMTPAEALLFLAALGLSSALPSTPGYVGVYQFVAVNLLGPFGITQSAALALILAYQGITYVVMIGGGLIGLWRLHIRPNELSHALEQEAEPTYEPIA